MFDLIAKLLPEWMIPFLIGLAVWFGANWLVIAPIIGERTVVKSCARSDYVYCTCVADTMVSNARWKIALWTATGGFYEIYRDHKVIRAMEEGKKQCVRT